jgi:antitoxin (DNA-binding transcriptional repressor) of toxin-antitoxin stability system
MAVRITATELRRDVYRLLDTVLATGESIEIERNGRKVLITPFQPVDRISRLVSHPGSLIGDPEEVVHMDWSGEWSPKE